MLYIYVAKIII